MRREIRELIDAALVFLRARDDEHASDALDNAYGFAEEDEETARGRVARRRAELLVTYLTNATEALADGDHDDAIASLESALRDCR